MYRVLKKNIAKIPDTARNMTMFAVRSERILKIDSRTSGAFVLSSMTTKLASRTNASANRPSVPAEALKCSCGDEHPLARGEAVEERRSREDDEADQEDPLAAEQVAGAAAEQEKAAEDERVGVDDPLQVALGQVEVLLDRRKCDVHDRRVEDDHELREADQDEDDPGIGRVFVRRRHAPLNSSLGQAPARSKEKPRACPAVAKVNLLSLGIEIWQPNLDTSHVEAAWSSATGTHAQKLAAAAPPSAASPIGPTSPRR